MAVLVIKYGNVYKTLTKMPETSYYISKNIYDYLLLLFINIKCLIRHYAAVSMLGIEKYW